MLDALHHIGGSHHADPSMGSHGIAQGGCIDPHSQWYHDHPFDPSHPLVGHGHDGHVHHGHPIGGDPHTWTPTNLPQPGDNQVHAPHVQTASIAPMPPGVDPHTPWGSVMPIAPVGHGASHVDTNMIVAHGGVPHLDTGMVVGHSASVAHPADTSMVASHQPVMPASAKMSLVADNSFSGQGGYNSGNWNAGGTYTHHNDHGGSWSAGGSVSGAPHSGPTYSGSGTYTTPGGANIGISGQSGPHGQWGVGGTVSIPF